MKQNISPKNSGRLTFYNTVSYAIDTDYSAMNQRTMTNDCIRGNNNQGSIACQLYISYVY